MALLKNIAIAIVIIIAAWMLLPLLPLPAAFITILQVLIFAGCVIWIIRSIPG